MELRHLRYFTVLAEELHFGRAAARLHMAQPPLSQRIRDLERELGVRLFDRGRNQVRLTEAGALLLEHARPVLESTESALEAMRRIRPGESGILRAGIPPDTMPVTLRTLVAELSANAPDVLVDLHELTTDEQLRALREGDLDVGVVRHPSDTTGLESGPVAHRPLGVLLPAEHPLSAGGPVRLRDLNGMPLVVFPRAMAPMLYDQVMSACSSEGFRPGAIRHARNPLFVNGLVLAGRGVHFNERPLGGLPEGLVWSPLEGNPLAWRTSVVWPPRRRHASVPVFVAAATAGLEAAGHVVQPHPEPGNAAR
ncbi:LysR substrate-binding domain-containing protein [Nocardiopsis sp. CT-R113]|uniref:LysR substrate-binding domain-containing protein n=1 Tax=Nocardiopsis codii TaxID=3065942 RepID=A0ABU7KEH0_9ACTN|nr:LysR substrate-binding domain-containing protein [Nocardiopsis sp. CT-R113]MEE2040636.1 LysR substrate-binding domain-containing protein [Nocardiopsis sp. CT-R113]